jgi:hypothetical protein
MSPLLAAAIDLTDRVQDAIDAGDWPRAQELEAQRRRLLEQLAGDSDPTGEVASGFATLEARNQRLIGLVQHHRRRVLRDAAVAKTAHDGLNAYAGAAEDRRAADSHA